MMDTATSGLSDRLCLHSCFIRPKAGERKEAAEVEVAVAAGLELPSSLRQRPCRKATCIKLSRFSATLLLGS